jgi:dihydroflavonol-4-reductase
VHSTEDADLGLAVVTGATGHVGATLVRQLLDRGVRVRAVLHRGSDNKMGRALDGLDVERVEADVRDVASLRAAFQGGDVLFHLAALISIVGEMGGKVRAVNVDGAHNAGRAAMDAGIRRMVHMCSVHAFEQEPLDQPVDETRTRVGPGGLAYDRSKADGEAKIRELVQEGLDAVILHPSGIIGPNDYRPSRMGKVLLDLHHRRLPALIRGGFDWVDVRDVSAAAISAAHRGRTNESYMVSGHYWEIPAFAEMCQTITGTRPPRLVTPTWLAKGVAPLMQGFAQLTKTEPLFTLESIAALQANKVFVREKAKAELGHDPRPTEQSVRDAYSWFAREGVLKRPPAAVQPDVYGEISTH